MGWLVDELAKRVPILTDEDELIARGWPTDAPWRWQVNSSEHRERLLSEARARALDTLRPGDGAFEQALDAWRRSDEAFAAEDVAAFKAHHQKGLDLAEQAFTIATARGRLAGPHLETWARELTMRVRLGQDRAAELEAREGRRRAEEERRRAEEERRRREQEAEEYARAYEDARRQRSRRATGPTGPNASLAERMQFCPLEECAAFLGVTFPCSPAELKKAHRDAVFRFHPDRIGGDTEKMKAAKIANDRLLQAVSQQPWV